MNISRYANIDKFVNIQYIFLLARRAYSWLFQLVQMWKLLAELITLVMIGTDCIGICKSNYHSITTTMAPTRLQIYSML
jgi:hypothetical protein